MKRIGIALFYLAVLSGGTYSAFRPTFDSGFSRTQAETGDGMLNHYLLEHSWRAVSDPSYCSSLLKPPFFYPERWVYWYSETLIGCAPVYWGLRLELPDHLAYQWWQILCAGLNFAAFAAVARWLRCSHPLAAFGGFLWAFALVHVDQAKHQQMIPRFWMPLAAYHAWVFATAPSARSLNRGLACLFLQAATCFYTGWFLVVGVATFVAAAIFLKPGGWRDVTQFFRNHRPRTITIILAWGLALAAFFAPYAIANFGLSRTYGECVDLIPTPGSWLTGPPGSRWHETISPYRGIVHIECCLFTGFGFYLLLIVATVQLWLSRRDPNRSAAAILATSCLATGGIWVLLTLNYGSFSPWQLVRFIPGGQAIRAIGRVYVLVDLFATVAAVVWLKAMTDTIRSSWVRGLVVVAVTAPIVFEQTGYEPDSFAKTDFYPKVEQLGRGFQGADAGYLIPRHELRSLYADVLAMWAGLKANVPVVNGYSGRYPDRYEIEIDDVDAGLRAWLGGRFRGRVAVVDPDCPEKVRYIIIE